MKIAIVDDVVQRRQMLALVLTSTGGYQVDEYHSIDSLNESFGQYRLILINDTLYSELLLKQLNNICYYTTHSRLKQMAFPVLSINIKHIPAFAEQVRCFICQKEQSKTK